MAEKGREKKLAVKLKKGGQNLKEIPPGPSQKQRCVGLLVHWGENLRDYQRLGVSSREAIRRG